MVRPSFYLLFVFSTLWFTYTEGNPSRELDIHSGRVKRGVETFTEGEFVPYSIDEKIDFCDNATFDAILILSDGCTYAFRGAYYWKVTNDKIMEGYPRLIQEDWAGLPTHLDAAFAYKDEIVFFKGSKYWKFTTNKIMKDGCPRYIKDGFPGIPDDIDGATPWGKHGYIYFFKGCYYWRYEPNCEHQVKKNYPKLISEVWEGVPDNIDDAILHTNGVLYFFKGVRHYRFNDAKLKIEDGYPTLNAPKWLSCFPEP